FVALEFAASGRRLVGAWQDDPTQLRFRLYDLEGPSGRPTLVRSLPVRSDQGFALDRVHLAGVPDGRSLTVFATETLAPRWSTSGRDVRMAWPTFSAGGRWLAAENGREAAVWETSTGRAPKRVRIEKRPQEVVRLLSSPDGTKLVVSYDPTKLAL